MDKRLISKKDYSFLKNELNIQKNKNIIDNKQVENILESYQVKQGLSFIKIILTLGAILVGLGILSFIASNWDVLNKFTKFSIIIAAYLGVNIVSFRLEADYPRISQSLTYLAIIIYGSGIFLVGQMFNYGGHFTSAFLLWALGVFPIALIYKDEYIFTFANILLLIYINGHFSLEIMPNIILLVIPLLYYTNKFFDRSNITIFFINLVTLNSILYYANKFNFDSFFVAILFFVIGILMYYMPLTYNRLVFRIQGSFVLGVSGIFLTIPECWRIFKDWGFITNLNILSISFAIAFCIYLFILTKSYNLIALLFICITIIRYYFDTFYDFLPKSMFFIIGGLILLGFGYYFERVRKLKGVIDNEL